MTTNSTERVKASRDKNFKLGRVRREYMATAAEHLVLKNTLRDLRKPENPPHESDQ